MRNHLIGPLGVSGFWIARPDGDRPLVVSRTHVCIPRPWITRAVVNQVEFGVVRNPAPNGASTTLPLIGSPSAHAQVLALVFGIKRFEVGTDAGISIGATIE